MSSRSSVLYSNCLIAGIVVSSWMTVPALAQNPAPVETDVAGRILFDWPQAPAATVEVDLNQGVMSALSSIGQAAVGGVAEALLDAQSGNAAPEIAKSAEHLQAVNEMLSELTGVVREVRVRVYDNFSDVPAETRMQMLDHYNGHLKDSNWDNIVRVQDRGSKVSVNLLRDSEAIRGIFVIVSEQDSLVLANVVCELTPDRIKQVTNGATKIGMKFGLERAIQQAMLEIEREMH